MRAVDVLTAGIENVRSVVHQALDDVPEPLLTARLDPQANTVAWLVWHLARVQDDHVAAALGQAEQVWTAQGYARRMHLPLDDAEIGYGMSSDDAARVRASARDLLSYLDAVCDTTVALVGRLDDDDLDRVVDTSYDPPVTLGVRLLSVLTDDLQHAGQAAYALGVLSRQRR